MPKFTKQLKQTIHKIYTTLKKAGFDDISIAGMLGNALSESSFNPDSISKSNYHGLWLNSNDLHNAVVGTYGNHNIDTLLQYVIDWTNAHKNVTKGKYRDWLATGAGKFKKSGYKDAHEASDAFMKLYERPAITDKNGNIIGYQKDVERRANSAIMYDYINSLFNNKPVVKMIDMGDGRKRMQVSYPHLLKSVLPTDWSSSEKRLPSVEKYIPEPITTDYTPLREVAEQYDALNGAGSPSYGGYTPRLQDVQEVNSRINHDILNLIGINPTINKFLIPFAQKYNKGKNTTVRTLPRFDEGTPTTVGPYNIYPSALRPTNQDIPYSVTTPEINIYGQDKRPLYQRYDAYGSTYDPNAIRSITDWVPGIGDVSLGFYALDAFKNQDYMQGGVLGASLILPAALYSPLRAGLKHIPTEEIKRMTDNFIKFADKYRRKVPTTIKGQEYGEFVRRFGHMLDMDRITPDDVRAATRGRKKEISKITEPHAVYDGKNSISYVDNGEELGGMSLYENNTGTHVLYVSSDKPGVGRKLYDSAIQVAKQDRMNPGLISGEDLVSAPKTYSIWKHYPSKKLLGMNGSHSNAKMILDEMGGGLSKLRETNSGPIYLLDQPSLYVPTKHKYMFDPSIIDDFGNMHINLKDPSIYKSLLPLIPTGAALYMGAKDFEQEDLNNAINNLKVLAEGVGYNSGKDIHIKPSKRGTFTAAAKKHNKSVLAFANQVLSNPGKYSKAMRKKALFAKNASKWKH